MLDLDELIDGMLVALDRSLPSEFISINDIGPDPDGIIAVVRPPQSEEMFRLFGQYAHENPLLARYLKTQDGRAYRFSDVISRQELVSLELYRQVYKPMGVEHQIAVILPSAPERVIAIAISRTHVDFSDAERDLLNAARPFLIQAWRNAIEHTALREELAARPTLAAGDLATRIVALVELGVSKRQAAVLAEIARGRSNRDAAASLGISERTVQKHLENAYRVLGVKDRSAAADLVWSLPPPTKDLPSRPRRGLAGR